MSENINLAEARKNLPELADRANAGQTFIVSRRGREVAALIGIEEYHRLKALEQEQRQADFNVLLAPPESGSMSEEEARQQAVQVIRETRQAHYNPKKL